MRGKKFLALVSFLVMLTAASVFGLGFINVSTLPFLSQQVTPTASSSSTPTVFVDPANIVSESLQSGSKFTVHVNISAVTDLFAWQINLTWNKAILNVSRVISNEFLARSVNLTSSEILGFVINSTGSIAAAEAIMADTTGVTGSGRLVSIEFLVVGYGSTDLTISLTGDLQTMLLDSMYPTNPPITFTKADGYFRNKYPGDINGDKLVGPGDFSILAGAYGSSIGQPAYNREADMNVDGLIGPGDFSILAGNYGKTFP